MVEISVCLQLTPPLITHTRLWPKLPLRKQSGTISVQRVLSRWTACEPHSATRFTKP